MNSPKKNPLFSTGTALALAIASTTPSSGALVTGHNGVETGNGYFMGAEQDPGFNNQHEPILMAFSSSATAQVVRPLNGAVAECSSVGAEYAASCTAAAYKRAARAASRPDYRDARKHLNDAARKLDRLVAQNADSSKPPLKKGRNTYKAVKTSAVAKVNAAAIKIIAETETKLLRSAGSGQRKVHYQRIAQAVGSTKVIFRS